MEYLTPFKWSFIILFYFNEKELLKLPKKKHTIFYNSLKLSTQLMVFCHAYLKNQPRIKLKSAN